MAQAKLPSTAVGRRRLLKLASMLEADAKNRRGLKFDLDSFGWSEKKEPTVSCGTTACAMGLAALSGAFKKQGLMAHVDHIVGDTLFVVVPRVKIGSRNYDDFAAAQKLFSISREQSHFLFSPEEYFGSQKGAKGERVVAARIRDFVAGRAAPEA